VAHQRLTRYITAEDSASAARLRRQKTGMTMADTEALAEIDQRIAVLRDNLRQLVEQAAGYSGAEDEERNADRIAGQQSQLDALIKERDALVKE
jgi:hypothetical protein